MARVTVQRGMTLLLVFASGAVVGGLTLHAVSLRATPPAEAKRRALAILDQKVVVTRGGDSKIVVAARRISPAVVNIDIVGRARQQDDSGKPVYVEQEIRGKGSGVVLTPDGYIVTNDHVIDGASRIRVTFADGKWQYARLVGRDQERDLAVLRVENQDLPCATFGNSDALQVGEPVIAVGNPMGLGSTVTAGIVSALNRHNLQIDDAHNLDGAIQTDAAINRGNSGGALADTNGQLIGVNTAILSVGPNGGNIGLGFALPINAVRRIVRTLIANGKSAAHALRKPWLGVEVGTVPEISRHAFSLAVPGAEIQRVLPETPASLAGLQTGDILLRIDGNAIRHHRDVPEAILRHKAGDKVTLHVLRPHDGRERDILVTIQEQPDDVPPAP